MTKLTDMIMARRAKQDLDNHSPQIPVVPGDEPSRDAQVIDITSRVDSSDLNARVISVISIEVQTQARKTFRHIEELAADIHARGQLQPIVVREVAENHYILLSGERRLRAIRDVLKQSTIAARLMRSANDEQSWRLCQLAENLQREDYEPLEIARELSALKEQFSYSNVTLAEQLNVSRAWVWRQLTLLEAPADIQASIENRTLAATEYLNNKTLYLSTVQQDDGRINAPEPSSAGNTALPTSKPVSRIAKVVVPMKTAQELVEILSLLSQKHQLSPIVLGKKPTKEELLAVLTTRTQEIKQMYQSLDVAGSSQQS